ncbi:cytochrome b, partial [Vibrio parahaemolyticus]
VGHYAAWETALAKGVHIFLLFATLALPISGILFSIGSARSIELFGIPSIPQILAQKDPTLASIAQGTHAILGKLIL